MLVLKRKIGEDIIIDGKIRIVVIDIEGKYVKLGFEAPKNVNIVRAEVLKRVEEKMKEAKIKEAEVEIKESKKEGK